MTWLSDEITGRHSPIRAVVYICCVPMIEINIREARQNLKSILDRVIAGEEVRILRRGKEIARVVPPPARHRRAPSLKEFRQSIRVTGKPMSAEVIDARKEERY